MIITYLFTHEIVLQNSLRKPKSLHSVKSDLHRPRFSNQMNHSFKPTSALKLPTHFPQFISFLPTIARGCILVQKIIYCVPCRVEVDQTTQGSTCFSTATLSPLQTSVLGLGYSMMQLQLRERDLLYGVTNASYLLSIKYKYEVDLVLKLLNFST